MRQLLAASLASALLCGCTSPALPDGFDVGGSSFVPLPAGSFTMGCSEGEQGCAPADAPRHEVTISRAFWIAATETTQQQWALLIPEWPGPWSTCVEGCPVGRIRWWNTLQFANALSLQEGLPACYTLADCQDAPDGSIRSCESISVSSEDGTVTACEGFRLPTEAEWEYAARGGEDFAFAGSDALDDVGWFQDNSDDMHNPDDDGDGLHPVALKAANGYDLYDMSGNAWEWVWDRFGADYYSHSPSHDPEGPAEGASRVARSGCWGFSGDDARVTARYATPPRHTGQSMGFRLIRTIPD